MDKRIYLGNGTYFSWVMTGEKTREVMGWLEDEHGARHKDTCGWWRTDEPLLAADRAKTAFPQFVN